MTTDTKDNILEYVVEKAEKRDEKCFIVTPNPEMIVASHKDRQLQYLLNSADVALCDGVGLSVAALFMAEKTPQRITGVDFMKSLCENVSKKPITVGFLGGKGKVAERTAECLMHEYPGLRVVFCNDEWSGEGFTKAKKYQEENNKNIPTTDVIDILFVAFGFPKQEQWISENLEKISVTVAMGVGGAFDYLSGEVSRAPFFLRAIGLEWLYRLVRQPWRWRRQVALIEFIALVIKKTIRR